MLSSDLRKVFPAHYRNGYFDFDSNSCLSPNMMLNGGSTDKFLGLRVYIQITAITLTLVKSVKGKAFRNMILNEK